MFSNSHKVTMSSSAIYMMDKFYVLFLTFNTMSYVLSKSGLLGGLDYLRSLKGRPLGQAAI